jgi:hypothetical protein
MLVFGAFIALACAAEPASTPMPIPILTASRPSAACEDALLIGFLVPDAETGLAVQSANGDVTAVVWPFGYSARYANDQVQLLNEAGTVVAVQGDKMEIGGGFGNNSWSACGEIKRVAPAS